MNISADVSSRVEDGLGRRADVGAAGPVSTTKEFRLTTRISIRCFRPLLLAVVLFAVPVAAWAHHALQSEFEINKPSRHWTGTLKAIEWINPHSRFVLDVEDGTGKVTTWTFETAAPNGLRRAGLSKDGFFEIGKVYTVIGYGARDVSTLAFVDQITFPDGLTVRIWFGDPNGSN